jgi:pyruvate kinase
VIRRTKIVATLGPATDKDKVLRKVLAVVDVVRLNYSHGTAEDQAKRVEAVRKVAAELGRDIGILADLQGPKIRVESFKDGPIELVEGQKFALDTAWPKAEGNSEVVGCAYTDLPRDVAPGDTLLLNDGAITMKIDSVEGTRINSTVLVGGILSNRKGINRLGGGLSAAALSFKDKIDIREAVALDVDFIAVSFPRSAADMLEARALVKEAQGNAALIAKIERAEALTELAEIIGASDGVMVARGDLGVEIGDAELPGWQKKIINQAREQNRMVITATQMMESMINSPIPTRAEVLDVANAVMDGTDAVMLSAETASGKYPVQTVEAMARVCEGAERAAPPSERIRLEGHFERTDEAIAMATTWTARNMRANAIIALTESGSTPLLMSRTDTRIPIFALTRHERTRRRMGLVRGVYPVDFTPVSIMAPIKEAIAALVKRGLLKTGDRVLLAKGDFTGPGGTNEMKILKVGEPGLEFGPSGG